MLSPGVHWETDSGPEPDVAVVAVAKPAGFITIPAVEAIS